MGSIAAAVVVAIGGLVALAPLVSPTTRPIHPEDGIVCVAWWVAAATLLWWFASVGYWVVALRSREGGFAASRMSTSRMKGAPDGSAVQSTESFSPRLAIPGSRRMAESLLALALFAVPACAPDSAEAPTMVLIGDASTTTATTEALDLASTSTPPTTTATSTTTSIPATTTSERAADPASDSSPSTLATEPDAQTGATERSAAADERGETDSSAAAPSALAAHAVVVKPGDNLWSLAADAIEAHLGRAPTNSEIGPYWGDVVATNRVRSGNPNLILPGETIDMPALSIS